MAYSSCAQNLLLGDSGFLLQKTSQENTPSTFLQESGQNRAVVGVVLLSSSLSANATCKLQGQYAFLFSGYLASNFAVSKVGEFTVNSSGHITSGVQDVTTANFGGGSTYSNSTITGGACTNGANGLNTLKLISGGVATTYKFVLTKAGNARMIEFDDTSGLGTQGSGIIRKQDKTAFSLAKIAGDFAFAFNGFGFGLAGRLTVTPTGTSASLNNGVAFYNRSNATASLTAPSAINGLNSKTGRGTATETYCCLVYLSTIPTTSHFAFYVVSADEELFLDTDTRPGDPLLSVIGEQLRQVGAGSFTNASLNSAMVYSETGYDGTSVVNPQGGTSIVVGQITADGNGTFSGETDGNDGGLGVSWLNFPLTGTYSINPDGTGSASLLGSYALVMIEQNTAFLLENCCDGGTMAAGQLELQVTSATVQGSYVNGTPAAPTAATVTNSVGVATFTPCCDSPPFNGISDLGLATSPFLIANFATAGTYFGSLLTFSDGTTAAGYVISPTKFVVISNTTPGVANATLVRYEQ